jgi:hypothetical protein
MSYRQVRASFTDRSITVYQAYSPQIADAAVGAQTFVAPFKRERMTWIKPSFLWMMYRSGWATTPGQERILPARSPARRPGRGQRAAGRVPGVGRRAVGRDGAGLAELRRRTPNPPTVGQPRGRRHSRHRRHLRPWNLMVSVTSSTTPFALARPILSSQTVQSYPVTRLNSAENTASAAGSYSSSPSRWSSDSTSSLYPHRARKPPRWPDDPSG